MARAALNLFLIGFGRMGKMIETLALERGHHIVGKVQKKNSSWENLEKADVVIDFSHSEAVLENVTRVTAAKKPIVVGTTGWEEQQDAVKGIINENGGTLLYAPNFSMGIFFFSQIIKAAAKWAPHFPEYDIQGVEIHHKNKVDAPSGTAKKIASAFKEEIPFTSIRVGNVAGKHSILFDSPSDTITLTHEARSREGFAKGAITAAEWVYGKKGWLNFEEMFET